jgi:hypothetical protein
MWDQGEFAEEVSMRSNSILAISAIVLSLGMAPARAEVCPAKSASMDDVIAALNEAPGCDSAMKVFGSCQSGASADVQFGAAVEKKCESDFLAKLEPPQKRAYQQELEVCDNRHRNQSGTMYLSFNAFCRARVAQHYSQQALKAAGSKPSR